MAHHQQRFRVKVFSFYQFLKENIQNCSAFLLFRWKVSVMCQWTLPGEKTTENTSAHVHECYATAVLLGWNSVP